MINRCGVCVYFARKGDTKIGTCTNAANKIERIRIDGAIGWKPVMSENGKCKNVKQAA